MTADLKALLEEAAEAVVNPIVPDVDRCRISDSLRAAAAETPAPDVAGDPPGEKMNLAVKEAIWQLGILAITTRNEKALIAGEELQVAWHSYLEALWMQNKVREAL